jgi:hypothetical protein
MQQSISLTVRESNPQLINDARKLITGDPPTDLAEAQQRIKILAIAVVAIAEHCFDLEHVLSELFKRAQFQAKP